MGKRTNIGSRLHSVERGNVVAGANEILDDAKGKKQNVINNEVDAELVRLDQSKQDNLTFDNQPTEGSDNPVKSGGVYAADKALSDAIEAILILIPSAATALNQLADKNFVNSSIATDTATFRGTSETGLSEAQFIEWANSLTHDMNDYVFWQTIDEAGNTLFKRYKWNGTQWLYEYTLNNSSFTADQWAAITSGITTALVEKLVGLPTNAALQQALNSKQNSLTFDNVPTENSTNPVKSGGVYSAVKAEENARLNLAQTVSEIGGDVSQIEDVIPTGATAQNQLVANASMGAYVASIIQNITASFTLSTADGHINLTLTQVNGRVATLTLSSSDIASAQALSALTGRVTTAEENITALGGRVSTNETDIANLQQLYNDLQQSKPVPVTALPSTGQQQGVIYRLAGTTSYSDYMWNGSTWVLMATYNNAIDPRPKKASQNLVLSGGVFDNMGALDVSELNATENPHTLALYVDLSAALAAIPTDYQKGGMSVKFVQSSDNNYVQYFLAKDEWSTTVSDWINITGSTKYLSYDFQCFRAFGTSKDDGVFINTMLMSDLYRSFVDLKLINFDAGIYRLSEIKRLSTPRYTLAFAKYNSNSDTWSNYAEFNIDDTSIEGGSFANKISKFDVTLSNGKRCIAYIDFTFFRGYNINKTLTNQNFVVKEECVYPNGLPIHTNDKADLQTQINSCVNDSDLTIEIVSNNIANPSNIQDGASVNNNGSISSNVGWSIISVPVSEGDVLTVGGFTLRRFAYYAYYNGSSLVSFGQIQDPEGTTNPTTFTVPSGVDTLYIDIKTDESGSNYDNLMINYGSTLKERDEFEQVITAINNTPFAGQASGESLNNLVVDLPTSDGTDIQSGYAYIDSTDRSVKVKA